MKRATTRHRYPSDSAPEPDSHVAAPADPSAESLAGHDRWEWIRPVLVIGSAVVALGCTLFVVTDANASAGGKLLAAGLAVTYAAWTIGIARWVFHDIDDQRVRWPLIYLVVAYSLFAAMVLVNPAFFLLAFLLYFFTFSSLPLRLGIPLAIVFSAEIVVLQVFVTGRGLFEDPSFLISIGVSIVFGIFMAVWIGGIIDQSHERALLIAELEATRAELAGANHEAGVRAEHERLAHEIHDTLAQGFTSIVMLSQAADAAVDTNPEAARHHLRSIERTARENLAEARHLVEGMGPAALSEVSLLDALSRLAERLAVDLGIEARTEVRGQPRPLASATEVVLLRAAQEATANVRKHADAAHVLLTLDFGPGHAGDLETDGRATSSDATLEPTVVLEVTDDGRGFDPGEVHDGFGLAGMQQRMARVGGLLEIDSQIGRGTTVKVELT